MRVSSTLPSCPPTTGPDLSAGPAPSGPDLPAGPAPTAPDLSAGPAPDVFSGPAPTGGPGGLGNPLYLFADQLAARFGVRVQVMPDSTLQVFLPASDPALEAQIRQGSPVPVTFTVEGSSGGSPPANGGFGSPLGPLADQLAARFGVTVRALGSSLQVILPRPDPALVAQLTAASPVPVEILISGGPQP